MFSRDTEAFQANLTHPHKPRQPEREPEISTIGMTEADAVPLVDTDDHLQTLPWNRSPL